MNPCFLPCGNTACLDCIYENYNIYKKNLKCNLCQQEHELPLKLIKNEKIFKNLNELVHLLIQTGNKIMNKRGKLYKFLLKSF